MDEAKIMAELSKATEGLLFQSETDSPIIPFYMPGIGRSTVSAGDLIATYKPAVTTPVKKLSVEQFFANAAQEQAWQGPEEKESVRRFQNLIQTLEQYLSSIQVFKIGGVEADVYVVGRTNSGDFAGVATKVVET